MVNLSWKDAGKLNTIMINAWIRIGVTIQQSISLAIQFSTILTVQIEGSCVPSHQEVHWELLWHYATNQMKSCEGLMLSLSQDLTKFSALLMLSGFPPCTSFPMSLFCSTRPKKKPHDSAFWCCWRLNTTVPLKVFHPFKTSPVKAYTGHSPRRWIVAFKRSGQLA